ncbi:flagellar hook-associated protein FlgL [Chitinivorax sp. PXF-14]|uniref:flagellar hook-associated protein FlgL n=1 Tax=Chitinivorax sp. PXF-14 TaxID=3230488 RepID=UPI003466F001
MAIRVSTSNIYALGVDSVRQNQADLVKLQQQVATGRRILTPSDDPVASAQILSVNQANGLNDQFKTNGDNAKSTVALSEGYLQSMTSLLQDVKTQAVYAGNPSLTQTDRGALLSELQERYKELIGLANSTDGNGQYLYSGYQGSTRPFEETAPGVVTYMGDQGQRSIQVSPSRALPVSESGVNVFQRIKEGNGTFVLKAGSNLVTPGANLGTGIVGPGTVVDVNKWRNSSGDFSIRFDIDATTTPSTTHYDIIDNSTNLSVITGGAPATVPFPTTLPVYQPNATISMPNQGITFTVDGAPAAGDQFTIKSAQDKQVFDTLTDFANLLKSAKDNPVNVASYQNSLNLVMQGLDNALTNVTTVQADVGTRLKEVDSVRDTLDDLTVQYSTQLRDLGDLDYAKAISDFSLTQTYLEAAQKTFVQTQKLSLFEQI